MADAEHIYAIVDDLDGLAAETGRSIRQLALNWLDSVEPSRRVARIGARNEDQLRDNLGAAGWALDASQVARLDEVSRQPVPYPYNHQQEKPYFLPAPWTTA